MKFNVESDADALERYLDQTCSFDEIGLTLFSHGVNSVGLAPIERWRSILQRATIRGRFVGVDEDSYPQDFGVFTRYNQDIHASLRRAIHFPRHLS